MILPVGDENVKNGSFPYVTYAFIACNMLAFFYELSLNGADLEVFFSKFAVTPKLIMDGENLYSLVTNMFLHGGIGHILGNLLFLWIFADNIEAVMGNVVFFLFYISGGVVASLAHVFSNTTSQIPALGASGAISAALGAYIVLFPHSKINVFVLFLFRNIRIPAVFFLAAWFIMQLFSSFQNIDSTTESSGVAWWAHIGGFLYGLIIAWIMKASRFIQIDQFYLKA